MGSLNKEIEELIIKSNNAQDNKDYKTMSECDQKLKLLYEKIGVLPTKPKVRVIKKNK